VKKVESEISERADRLKEAIESEKRKLVADLYEIQANYEKEMDNGTHEITKSRSSLDSLRKYCELLLKRGTASDISRQVNSLQKRIEELDKTDDNIDRWSVRDVRFLPFTVKIDGTNNFLGQVITEGK